MRSDYALYIVAIIFFILTGIVGVYQVDYREVWIITTAVLGLFFVGLGYTQRPRAPPKTAAIEAPSPATPTTTPQMVKEEKELAAPQVGRGLTEVKGIGVKRAEQLKALGILTVEDLAKASAEDLASKLKVSPKITEKWIKNAKKLIEKS